MSNSFRPRTGVNKVYIISLSCGFIYIYSINRIIFSLDKFSTKTVNNPKQCDLRSRVPGLEIKLYFRKSRSDLFLDETLNGVAVYRCSTP